MKIIETNFFWNGVLSKRNSTKYIVLHHRAGEGDAQSIHSQHLNQGWSGIGYHFYIRKNGEVYQGRPIDKIGAHTQGNNYCSVGVCFEGNYETEKEMPSAQLEAGRELISYLRKLYPSAEVKGHRDLQSTACPGKYFPFEEIAKGELKMDIERAKDVLKEKAGLLEETIKFLSFYKYGEDLIVKLAKAIEK